MNEITKDLYQFSAEIPFMKFTIHQYLFVCDEPVLISTGTIDQAEKIMPQIKEILKGRDLKYILVPHIESDECGGLPVFLREYPEVEVLCSELSARELQGYGYRGKVTSKKNGEELRTDSFKFKFIDYPSEVHLQNGLVFYEEDRKILFSSDLMLSFGEACGKVIESRWKAEIDKLDLERVPNEDKLNLLKENLRQIKPEFIAVGHGYCIRCTE